MPPAGDEHAKLKTFNLLNNNNNRRLVTLAEHTSDHGRQTNSSTEEQITNYKIITIPYPHSTVYR